MTPSWSVNVWPREEVDSLDILGTEVEGTTPTLKLFRNLAGVQTFLFRLFWLPVLQ